MNAIITNQIQRKGFCGDQSLHDYLILDTPKGEMMILRDDFPLDVRQIGQKVELNYVAVGGGWAWAVMRSVLQ